MNWLNSFRKSETALLKLDKTIFESSILCAESLKKNLEEKFGKDSEEKYIYVLFEFMCFFLHLTNRSAFAQLGEEKLSKLHDKLGPMFIDTTIETLFGHWPEKLKEGIKHEFVNNINSAEMEYSECKGGLLVKDHPFSDDALFSKLAKNVARISGDEANLETIMQCIEISVKIFSNMELDHLIDLVGKEL